MTRKRLATRRRRDSRPSSSRARVAASTAAGATTPAHHAGTSDTADATHSHVLDVTAVDFAYQDADTHRADPGRPREDPPPQRGQPTSPGRHRAAARRRHLRPVRRRASPGQRARRWPSSTSEGGINTIDARHHRRRRAPKLTAGNYVLLCFARGRRRRPRTSPRAWWRPSRSRAASTKTLDPGDEGHGRPAQLRLRSPRRIRARHVRRHQLR